MNSKFLNLKVAFTSFLFLILFSLNSLAQFDIEKTKKELTVRNIYTIIEVSETNNNSQNGDIFAGTWGAGIWKSTDMGNTWNRRSEGLLSYDIRKLVTSNSNRIFAATAKGLYYTDNGGLNWSVVNGLDEKDSYRNIVINGNDIYVVADDGKLYKSRNNGLSWSQTGKINEPIITAPIIISENKMLVGTENGLLISEDEGRTWIKVSNEIINETIKDISLINETLYITTLSKGIFISGDYGNTISKFDNGLQQKRVKKVASDARGNVFATIDDEVPYTLNTSANIWQQGYSNISASSIEFISSNRDGKMVAAITSGGKVLFSNDAGASWRVGSKLIGVIPNTHFVELRVPNEGETLNRGIKSYTPPPVEFLQNQNRLNKTTDSSSARPSLRSSGLAPLQLDGLAMRLTTTKINVTYDDGIIPEARVAFQYAADIWASIINTPVEINVRVYYVPLADGILADCGPGAIWYEVDNEPIPNTCYHTALAEKLAGIEINLHSDPDIIVRVNSNYPANRFYFRTDGNTPLEQYDFVSLILHELCHGLGYTFGFSYNAGRGSWSNSYPRYPYIGARFLFNGNNQALIDTTIFPNPSIELGRQLTSDNIYWNGPNVTEAKMYAPANYYSASSILHLDDATYFPGSENHLMTPWFYGGTATHSPGDIVLKQLADMGWGTASSIVTDSTIEIYPTNITFSSVIYSSQQRIVWIINDGTDPLVVSSISIVGTGFRLTNNESTITVQPGDSYTLRVQFLPTDARQYFGTLILTYNRSDSPTNISLMGYGLIEHGNTFLFQNNPNPVRAGSDVTIRYRILTSRKVTLTVYDILGREVAKLLTNEEQDYGLHSVNFNTKGLTSGVYFYKLRVKDHSLLGDPIFNPQVYEETKKMLIIR
jgi:photosystem II stability/assembly factor-like uncharacterized protein